MSSRVEIAYEYCKSITRTHAKSFYFAVKFLPKKKQRSVYALYALCRQVDDAVDEGGIQSETEAIEIVNLWETELNKIYSKISNSEQSPTENSNFSAKEKSLRISPPSEHVLIAWQDMLVKYKIPRNLPLELIKGVLMDTYIKRYKTFDELYIYCYRVASTVGLMSSEILGYAAPETLDYAEALGIGMQLTNILRDIDEDAEMGRIYLPQEDLINFGVTEEQIFAKRIDENFIELMKFEIARAREFYQKAEKGIALLEQDTHFTVLLALRLYAKILNEIERQNYDIFSRRAHTTKTQKIFSLPSIWLESKMSRKS